MTEQQPYELLRRYADFELRRYPEHTVAEVEVDATFDRAGNAAFRHLFNYISGNNAARQSVAMTAPVLQGAAPTRKPPSQKVQMTAPVLQQGPLGGGPAGGRESDGGAYVVSFVLPTGMTEETAPVPADPRVTIRAVPGSTAAVVRFSGRGTEADFAKRNRELQEALTAAGLKPSGAPRFARFDPPFKPWFLRHNEVIQDVAPDQAARPPTES
ncbi:SOUL family heme-binding protein [Sinomonas sp. B1-1]|uniref:SOUL family heme-binding protein n=1 Tax=Sinomonas sp. B1-1 TaxID=3141454 RepID=UPI003D2CBF81